MVIPSLEPIERAGQCYRGSSEPTGLLFKEQADERTLK